MQLARGTGVPKEHLYQMSSSIILSSVLNEFAACMLKQEPELYRWLGDWSKHAYQKTDDMRREEERWQEYCQLVTKSEKEWYT